MDLEVAATHIETADIPVSLVSLCSTLSQIPHHSLLSIIITAKNNYLEHWTSVGNLDLDFRVL